MKPSNETGVTDSPAALPVVACSAWLAAFLYRPQLKACDSDGTCKRMTPELRAMMQERDQKRYDDIFAFQFPELEKYHGGPRFCGKEPGICSGNHCRSVHFRLADAAGEFAANDAGEQPPPTTQTKL